VTGPLEDVHSADEATLSADEAESSAAAGKSSTVGWRFALVFAGAVTLSVVVALVSLNAAGAGARKVPAAGPNVVVVDDTKGLLGAWERAGVHGAQMVYVTRDLGYAVPPNSYQHNADLPVQLRDLRSTFVDIAARTDLVWVAAHTGIARSVSYVVHPQALAEKVRVGRENGWPGIAADGRSIVAGDEEGYDRVIRDRFPPTSADTAVLNIDASYFVNGTPEELAEQISQSGQSFGLVTLNRSVDATDVPDAARVKLDRMADLLREQASK